MMSMSNSANDLDKRLDKIDEQLERMVKVIVKGFADTNELIDNVEANLKSQIARHLILELF